MTELRDERCVPCKGGMPALNPQQYLKYLSQIKEWQLVDDVKIEKKFKFKNFKEALAFVNKVGKIAEEENHHPNIYLYGWNKVKITLTTHAIHGLSKNDFILAAKIDKTTL